MAGAVKDGLVDQARACYEAGEFARCRELALEALGSRPDDAELLRLAGLSSLELDFDDALDYLRKAVEIAPGDAAAWRDLGEGLAFQGRPDEAADAFRKVVELRRDDSATLIDLGHSALAAGRTDEAISSLSQAAEQEPGNAAALRALADIHRRAGRVEEALEAARRLAELDPDDVLAALDVAELSLEVGRLDEASAEFRRLRSVDDDPEHEVYAYHGMIDAEIRRERWRGALDLAVDATRVDRLGRTTDLLAFVVAEVFGGSDRPSPSRAEVDAALALSRAEHRRLHAEAVVG